MKFTTLIPLRFNDGSLVPPEQIDAIVDELARQFDGSSDEGVTKGQWLDPDDARLYRDESRRVSVVCKNSDLWRAQKLVINIGQVLGQKAMYFEVRDYDGVQFLKIPRLRKPRKKPRQQNLWAAFCTKPSF